MHVLGCNRVGARVQHVHHSVGGKRQALSETRMPFQELAHVNKVEKAGALQVWSGHLSNTLGRCLQPNGRRRGRKAGNGGVMHSRNRAQSRVRTLQPKEGGRGEKVGEANALVGT